MLTIIINAAKQYENVLNKRHFCIVFKKKDTFELVEVAFQDINFLHLTGVKTKLSAKVFYSAALSGKLSLKDIAMDSNGTTQLKMQVLPFLHELLFNNCMIGDFINSGICIKADYFVGNTKAVLSVGFRYGKNIDFPVTLYKEDVRKLSQPTNKVLAIFAKDYQQKKYKECTYISKGQNEKELLAFINNEV